MINIGDKGIASIFPDRTGVELITMMCEAALLIERATLKPRQEDDTNPFLAKSDHQDRRVIDAHFAVRFHDAARATLRELEHLHERARLPKSGFVSLGEVMERNVEPIRFTREHIFAQQNVSAMWQEFVFYRWKVFSQAAQGVYRLAYHGLDLYRMEDGSHTRVRRDHPDRIFLSELGRREAKYKFWEFPDWAHLYFFDAAHIELRDIFLEHDFTEEQYEIKLRAFHREIGVDADEKAPSEEVTTALTLPGDTKLLRIVRHVLEKFSGTSTVRYPKATAVADYLQEGYGLSRREAEAVDLVTRPDSLRGKGQG